MNRKRVTPTIPPVPRLPLVEEGSDVEATVKNLRSLVNTLTQQVTFLGREVRLQRKVYLQTLSFLGYDVDRLRALDRKIREENG